MIIPAGVLVHRATRPLRGTVAVLFVSRVVVAGRVVDSLCACVSIQLTLSQESVDSTDPFARKCVDSTNASQESPKEVPGTVPVLFTCTVRVPVPVKRPGGSPGHTPALSTPFRGSPHASKTARLVQSNLAHARRAVPITCPPSQTVSHCSLYSSVITSHHVLSTPISDSISVCSCRSEHRSAAQLRSCEGWSCSPKDDLR